jgi:hypothetical protein
MRLAKRNVVKFRLTYKELTIAFGVAIAILVFAVTYASGQAENSTLVPHIYIPSLSATNISKAIVSFIF